MKPVVLCIFNNKIVSDKFNHYSKVPLKYENFNYASIGLGKNMVSLESFIEKEIEDSKFHTNTKLLSSIEYAKTKKSKIHIIGDIAKDENNLYAILKACEENGIKEVYLHLFVDKNTDLKSLNEKVGIGKICNFIDIDIKDNLKIYDAIVRGKKINTDENLENKNVNNNDLVIFFNNSIDVYEELIQALTSKNFKKFSTKTLKNINILTIFTYNKIHYMYDLPRCVSLGKCISDKGLKQLRCNINNYEFDGFRNKKYKGEKIIDDDILKLDLTKYDLVITHLDSEEDLIKLNDKIVEMSGIMAIVSENENQGVFLLSKKVNLKHGDITSVAGTILDLFKLRVPSGMGKTLISNRFAVYGVIFRIISVIFILSCMIYYITRFLYFYITK
ncbi:MAG: hypothetical protein IJ565_03560 [Bacilli bacterium]|nr:hypothetical protein [Bacilli bacterium]